MTEGKRLLAIDSLARVPGTSRLPLGTCLAQMKLAGVRLSHLVDTGRSEVAEYLGWTEAQERTFHTCLDRDPAPFEELAQRGVRGHIVSDSCYPTSVWDRARLPWFFSLGNVNLLDLPVVSFSGQRDAGNDGLAVTRTLAREAVERGWVVVSGGARGIDSAAHAAALDSGGTTVVILAEGIANWRMPSDLYDAAATGRLLVMSEFLPFDAWSGANAMQRNRTIARLAKLLFVPQAGTSGGTHNTASFAVRERLPLFVADLPHTGNQTLLQNGAKSIVWQGDRPDFDAMIATRQTPVSTQAKLF